MELIGSKIQSLRKNKRLTQAQLAEALAVSAQTVSKWENHLSAPDIALLPVIARYFGITMDELFNYRLDALNWRERFIRFMADNGVLQFGQFRLKSGRTSPYYVNTGNYHAASQLARLGEFYASCMRENNVAATLLAGSTERETPMVMAACMTLHSRYGADVSWCLGGAGRAPETGDRIVLIKDTLTSGQTLRAAIDAMRTEDRGSVTDVIVSVDRMERRDGSPWSARHEIECDTGVRIHAIVTVDDIIRAVDQGIVGSRDMLCDIRRYRETYGGQ